MVDIYKIRDKKSRYGFIIRTKDRCDITLATLPALAAESEIDVYWIDGSSTEEGQSLARDAFRNFPGLCEVHCHVNTGHIGSFVHGVKALLEKDYDYLGFVDGDVLAEPGWFGKMIKLYDQGQQDGLHVGMVSARSIEDRILVPRDGYALMVGPGAGFTLMKKDVCLKLMGDQSNCFLEAPTFLLSQIWKEYKDITEINYPLRNKIRDSAITELKKANFDPNFLLDWHMSTDWWWDVVLLKSGMVSLVTTPSYARNIDEDGAQEKFLKEATVSDPNFDWSAFKKRLDNKYQSTHSMSEELIVNAAKDSQN